MFTYWITGLLVAMSAEGKSGHILDYRPTCSNVSGGQEWSSFSRLTAKINVARGEKKKEREKKRKEKTKKKTKQKHAFSWFFSGFTKSGKGTDSVTDGFQLFVAETDRPTGRDGSRDNDDGV